MTLTKLENIDLIYNKKHILKDISFEISENEFVTIIGPNGAGKTSLLKVLLGITKASKGNIYKRKDLRIGYVPQKAEINENLILCVEDFLKLCEKDDSDFENIIKNTKIENLLDKNFNNLSGGEKQKVLLAKSLISKPNLLILDEPTQNLDISSQIEFYKLLNDIYKTQKISILMVSHDLHIVMSSSNKVICLYNHICCQGKPEEISKNSDFISIFGQDMDKLLTTYSHFHNHKH